MISNENAQNNELQQTVNVLTQGFFINGVRVCPKRGEIYLAAGKQSLEPKVMDVLVQLVVNNGQVVSAEYLFEQVWPKSIYSPVSVRRCIAMLRKVFADEQKSLIKTHPKRGYSLTAEIQLLADDQPEVAKQPIQKNKPPARFLIISFLLVIMGCVMASFYWYNNQASLAEQPQVKPWQVANLRPLTATEDQEAFAQFTNSNDKIVYLTKTHNGTPKSELWLKNLATGQASLLFTSDEDLLYFAYIQDGVQRPDNIGKHSLLLASKVSNGVKFQQLNFQQNWQLTGQSDVALLKDATRVSPFFADNKAFYFLGKIAGQRALYQGKFGTGQIELLLASSSDFSPYKITKRPQDDHISVLGFDRQHISQLKQFSLATRQLTQLKTLDANWYFIAQHPAGGYLLSDGKSLFQLMDYGELLPIRYENYDFLHYPQLSPDGKSLLYTQANIKGNIHVIEPASGQHEAITQSNMHNWQASISPRQDEIAYVSNRNGHSQIFIFDRTTKSHNLVYANKEQHLALAQPVWSPDGMKIASARNDHVFVIDLSEAEPVVSHYDHWIGQPKQWYLGEQALLVQQKSAEQTSWFKAELITKELELLKTTPDSLLLDHRDHLLQLTSSQILAENGRRLWQFSSELQVQAYFPKTGGVYLLMQSQESGANRHSVWYFDYLSQETRLLKQLDLADLTVSDISEQLILASDFELQKDLVLLSVN